MNTTQIKCPSCGHEFPIDEILNHQAEEKYKLEYEKKLSLEKENLSLEKKKIEEDKIKLEEWKKNEKENYEKERLKISKEEEEKAKKILDEQYQIKLKSLTEENEKRKQENQSLKEKELAFLKREEQLKEKEQEIELLVQRQLNEEREQLEEKIKKQEQERTDLKFKELQIKLEQQIKLADELKRKAEQGSMQLQGEAQEIFLEELLKTNFPFDSIKEIGKGQRGADCHQTVRNKFGNECGCIYYESKKTVAFGGDWIEKLKKDMRANNYDIAVIVTQTMPKDMQQFGEKDGIWICQLNEVVPLAHVLRYSLLKVYALAKSQENKGDKMQLLYDYLTGSEFNEQWKAIREGFLSMKQSIDTERTAMEKLWKSREKQLEKILLNAAHISGSVEGIAGMENIDMKLLEE